MDGGVGHGAGDAAPGSLRGRLLVATPPLLDPNFVRTVVYLLEHNPDGALGVVLNRPTATMLGEVLPAWGDLAAAPGVVFLGGPVQPDGMIGLAALRVGDSGEPVDPDDCPGLRRVGPGVGAVDLEGPPEAVQPWVDAVRCYAGYAGWGPGQLEGELAAGSWFVVDREPRDVWCTDPGALWQAVLRRQPGRLAWFARCPLDPSTN